MNDDSSMARQLLAPLRDGPLPVPGSAEVEARRQLLLPGLRALVAVPPAPRSRPAGARVVLPAVALLAAAAAALFVISRADPEPLAHVRAARGVAVSDLAAGPLAAGAEVRGSIETREGSTVSLDAAGVSVELGASSRLNVARLAAGEVELGAGSVRCSVPPLGASRQFAVVTPEARVVVHGTVFSVERVASEARTCVRVEHGRVAVHAAGETTFLGAGHSFGCTPPSAPPEATARSLESLPLEPSPERRAPRDRSSALAQQNALLQRALAAEQHQDYAGAAKALDELAARHPESPLLGEARRVRARIDEARRAP